MNRSLENISHILDFESLKTRFMNPAETWASFTTRDFEVEDKIRLDFDGRQEGFSSFVFERGGNVYLKFHRLEIMLSPEVTLALIYSLCVFLELANRSNPSKDA